MHGKIDQTDIIKGTLNPTEQIRGKLNPAQQMRGLMTLPQVVPPDIYEGETVIVPSSFTDQELATRNKMVKTDILVKQIPYYETSNESGITVYIGNDDLIIFGGN